MGPRVAKLSMLILRQIGCRDGLGGQAPRVETLGIQEALPPRGLVWGKNCCCILFLHVGRPHGRDFRLLRTGAVGGSPHQKAGVQHLFWQNEWKSHVDLRRLWWGSLQVRAVRPPAVWNSRCNRCKEHIASNSARKFPVCHQTTAPLV